MKRIILLSLALILIISSASCTDSSDSDISEPSTDISYNSSETVSEESKLTSDTSSEAVSEQSESVSEDVSEVLSEEPSEDEVIEDYMIGYIETITDGIFTMDVYENGIRVTAIEPYSDELIIPAEYGDKKIISIGEEACSGKNIKTLTIREGIVHIDRRAFAQCSELTTVNFAKSVKYIGDEVFKDCSILYITLTNSIVDMGEGIFDNNGPNFCIFAEVNSMPWYYARRNKIPYLSY